MIVPALSGPSASCLVSAPSTLKKPVAGGAAPPARPELGGNVTAVSDSSSPPAAADTPCSLATAVTSADVTGEYCGSMSWTLWPAAFWHRPSRQISMPAGPA
jgi:hypothetical protein